MLACMALQRLFLADSDMLYADNGHRGVTAGRDNTCIGELQLVPLHVACASTYQPVLHHNTTAMSDMTGKLRGLC